MKDTTGNGKSGWGELEGKRVLITGAGTGIGRATAKLFAAKGALVGIHYRASRKEAEKLLKEMKSDGARAALFHADLTKSRQRQKLIPQFVRRFGGIDILVNNAGAVCGVRPFTELDEKSWDETFELNVKSAFFLAKDAFPHMKKQRYGRIINVSSVAAKYGGSEQSIHYGAAKAALELITVGMSRFGAPHNILVNSVRGGFIDTDFHKKIGRTPASIRKRIQMIPLKRAGKPEEVAKTILFLASSAADFITGDVISVTGGD